MLYKAGNQALPNVNTNKQGNKKNKRKKQNAHKLIKKNNLYHTLFVVCLK
jgi:hypothetical protein